MQMMKRLLAFLLCLLLLCPAAVAESGAPVLEVHQMVLGYADGYFIRCGDVEIMIDGGNPNPGSRNDDVVNCLRALGADSLDMYIITHWHLDHCEKLNVVLAEFGSADTVVYSPSPELHEDYAPLANGVYRQMKIDDVIEIGGLVFTCIGPEKLAQNGRCNSDSLNFVIQYGRRRMLFTGDYAQSGMINKRYPELCADVDVLKFPHHGGQPYEIGNNASRLVSPEYVLMPSQLNNYKAYCFLKDNGVQISRDNVLSNRAGHVVILTDGGDYFEARMEQDPADYAPKTN